MTRHEIRELAISRAIAAYRMRTAGMLHKDIGAHLGFSASRAQQLVTKGERVARVRKLLP
jgi:hypothetical protein